MSSSIYPRFIRHLRRLSHRTIVWVFVASLGSSCSTGSDTSEIRSDEDTNHRVLKDQFGSFNINLFVHGEGSIQACELMVQTGSDTVRTEWEGDPVMKMETADLDGDALPEILIITQSAGSGSYGSVMGFTLKSDQGLVPIVLPELSDDTTLSTGYMGHDRFTLSGRRLIRNFPLYRAEDSNSTPSDTSRSIIYSFLPDKTAPRFRIEGAMLE
ncbi:MAG: PliI family lysozyme inhibitor of I-type lysozyme [Bacteroidota bacterium]